MVLGKAEEGGGLKWDPKAVLSLVELMHSSRPATDDNAAQGNSDKSDVTRYC